MESQEVQKRDTIPGIDIPTIYVVHYNLSRSLILRMARAEFNI